MKMARVAVPGVAHHVTQRVNLCLDVFFSDDDCRNGWLSSFPRWYFRLDLVMQVVTFGSAYSTFGLDFFCGFILLIVFPDIPSRVSVIVSPCIT